MRLGVLNILLMTTVMTVVTGRALATDDEDLRLIPQQHYQYRSHLNSEEVYSRTQSVLEYYQVPAQPTGEEELISFNGTQSFSNIKKLLRYFDPEGMFNKLYSLSSSALTGFDDIQGKTQVNFKVNLRPSMNLQEKSFVASLRGLRIAIDPGHMGGKDWDEMTGKFVRDGKGKYLSEGVIALQTSLLLKQELEGLGAEVELTRTGLKPVTQMNLEQLPIENYARNELLENIHTPWFQKLLEKGQGNVLFKAFDNSPERKKLFSSNARYNYFILREDLWARSEKINAFKPNITLIIHYDVLPSDGDGHNLNEDAQNQTRIFVTGGFLSNEFGSRKVRKQFAKKLLDQTQWDESIKLGRNILTQFKTQMNLELPTESPSSVTVEPGIFARNLGIPRSLESKAIVYLECLFYNRPQEFYALSAYKYPMTIDGANYPYSDRLKQVVNSIKQGVIDYAELDSADIQFHP